MADHEWKICDLGEGRFGYMWLVSHYEGLELADEDGNRMETPVAIMIDPTDLTGQLTTATDYMHRCSLCNALASLEKPESARTYHLVRSYCRHSGPSTTERNATGYSAPWFPETAAELTKVGVAAIIESEGDHA